MADDATSVSESKGASSSVSSKLYLIERSTTSCEEVSLLGVMSLDMFVVRLKLEKI